MEDADVCLILEGAYPYARGAAGSWAHDLIEGMPDLRFWLVALVANAGTRIRQYELPANVVGLQEVALEQHEESLDRPHRLPAGLMERVSGLHRDFGGDPRRAARLLRPLLAGEELAGAAGENLIRALVGEQAWSLLLSLYEERGMDDCAFNAYYQTFLETHFRFLKALSARSAPARLYHAAGTGYGGLLGAAASLRSRRPLMLTEHLIYTNERQLDIAASDWLAGNPAAFGSPGSAPAKIRRIWTRMFETMGLLAYDQASVITTFFEGNRRLQVQLGADPARTRIIPNGVDVARLSALERSPDPAAPRIALVGSVVPINDLRTFIKACAQVARRAPAATFEVLGPVGEDPLYFEACRRLAEELNLKGSFEFRGRVELDGVLPRLSLHVLTSMSEGLPLQVLETMACGVPNVVPRAGGCEGLVLGVTPEDRALGPAGRVVSVASPEETARAILELLANPEEYERCARSARRRVARFYDRIEILAQYRDLYSELLARPDASGEEA